jgi:hypothetical protein
MMTLSCYHVIMITLSWYHDNTLSYFFFLKTSHTGLVYVYIFEKKLDMEQLILYILISHLHLVFYLTDKRVTQNIWNSVLKATVSRDFPPMVFFIKLLPLGLSWHKVFENGLEIAKIFDFQIVDFSDSAPLQLRNTGYFRLELNKLPEVIKNRIFILNISAFMFKISLFYYTV